MTIKLAIAQKRREAKAIIFINTLLGEIIPDALTFGLISKHIY